MVLLCAVLMIAVCFSRPPSSECWNERCESLGSSPTSSCTAAPFPSYQRVSTATGENSCRFKQCIPHRVLPRPSYQRVSTATGEDSCRFKQCIPHRVLPRPSYQRVSTATGEDSCRFKQCIPHRVLPRRSLHTRG